MRTLGDLLESISDLADDLTIFAEKRSGVFTPLSRADAISLTDADLARPMAELGLGRVPGMEYLLEVAIAREVLAVWSNWRGGRSPSLDEAVAAVIYYAEHDAYQPIDATEPSGGSDGAGDAEGREEGDRQ